MARKIIKKQSLLSQYTELLVYLILCFQIVSTAVYYNPYNYPLIHKMLLAQITTVMAWFIFLAHCFIEKRFFLRKSPYYWPLLALVIWSGIRAYTAPNADAVRNYWIFFNIVSVFPLWITCLRNKKFRSLLLWTICITGLFVILGCLWQLSHEDPKFTWQWFKAITLTAGSYDRQNLGSFMGHNNESTGYIVISSILTALLWFKYQKKTWWFVFPIYITVALILVYLGGSRSAVLMIPPAVLFIGLAFLKQLPQLKETISSMKSVFTMNRLIISGTVFGVFLIALVIFFKNAPLESKDMPGVVKRFIHGQDHLVSGTYSRVWWMSLLMAKDNPVSGVGFSSWAYKYPAYQKEWFTTNPKTALGLPGIDQHTARAHNDYLHLLGELGIVGLFIMLWLLFVHFQTLFKILSSKKFSAAKVFVGAATLGTLTQAFFYFPFHLTAASCLFIANVGLLSSLCYSDEWKWIPDWLTVKDAKQRQAFLVMLLIPFLLFSYWICIYVVADSCAIQHFNCGIFASREKDREKQKYYFDLGYSAYTKSVETMDHQGKYLYELGSETIANAERAKSVDMMLKGIDYINRSILSYSFYRQYEHLGDAYYLLWDWTKKPDYWELAVKNYQEAVDIMPAFNRGYVQLAVLQAKKGNTDECLLLLSGTELRFKGFIKNHVIPAAWEYKNFVKDVITADLLMNLAISIIPDDPEIFNDIMKFYAEINRPDVAIRMFTNMAQYQPLETVNTWMPHILLKLLDEKRVEQASDMLKSFREKEELQSDLFIWYYSGLVEWLNNRPSDAIVCWKVATDLGVNYKQIEQPYNSMFFHLMLPIILQ
jgi:O-antigen ligase